HEALVAGAARIDSHGDVGRLRLNQVVHSAGVGIETVRGVIIADVFDGAARDSRHVDVRFRGDLAGDDAGAGGHQDFARHSAGRVVGEDGVQHGVRNLVGDLVGMAFGDGFRGENV